MTQKERRENHNSRILPARRLQKKETADGAKPESRRRAHLTGSQDQVFSADFGQHTCCSLCKYSFPSRNSFFCSFFVTFLREAYQVKTPSKNRRIPVIVQIGERTKRREGRSGGDDQSSFVSWTLVLLPLLLLLRRRQ